MDSPYHGLPTRKKPSYRVDGPLRAYLVRYAREQMLPVSYERLMHYDDSVPLYNNQGCDTLWETVVYPQEEMQLLGRDLTQIYAILKTAGDFRSIDHLYVDRIDYCTFGNSHPFRIRIVNSLNDNQDYYYIKKADASRIYGLELEHLLSPNRLLLFTHGNTLVEEHIAGIPGDVFIQHWLEYPNLKAIRLAKELVKFNERCFIRLLGDMRSYNFVVELTPDFEDTQIRIRAMDFDQQSYSGRKNFYRPQYFKENYPLVNYCQSRLSLTTARQYQREERAQIHHRIQVESIARRLKALIKTMMRAELAPQEKLFTLRRALAEHYQDKEMLSCSSMGELLRRSLHQLRR